MYVVIVGVGGIGNLASFLISDVHDFTIIESNDNYVVKPWIWFTPWWYDNFK